MERTAAEILTVRFRNITQEEKVMFMCGVNHLMALFNCTGRPAGMLGDGERARPDRISAHFLHTGTLLAPVGEKKVG